MVRLDGIARKEFESWLFNQTEDSFRSLYKALYNRGVEIHVPPHHALFGMSETDIFWFMPFEIQLGYLRKWFSKIGLDILVDRDMNRSHLYRAFVYSSGDYFSNKTWSTKPLSTYELAMQKGIEHACGKYNSAVARIRQKESRVNSVGPMIIALGIGILSLMAIHPPSRENTITGHKSAVKMAKYST